jgi:hypothetical protein
VSIASKHRKAKIGDLASFAGRDGQWYVHQMANEAFTLTNALAPAEGEPDERTEYIGVHRKDHRLRITTSGTDYRKVVKSA